MSKRTLLPKPTDSLLRQLNQAIAAVADRAGQSLVRVTNGRRSAGAGVVLHEQGLIVTNAHVVRGRKHSVELADGRQLPASLLGADARRDLAALSVEADDLIPLEFGDSRRLAPGAFVMALGHPFGIVAASTAGVAIGAGSDLPGAPPGREWLALSLHLRPGHSGGPTVDDRGRLLGLNTIMAGPDVGLAVPAHVVKDFLRRMLSLDPSQLAQRRAGRHALL